VASFSRSDSQASLSQFGDRARLRDLPLLRIIVAAGALCAASPAGVRAAPDPCTGVGIVTCSGNQSAGVDAPPGTSVLNVNSLTTDIAPTIGSGQPGILFFGTGDITLVSATSPFRIVISDDFVDGIVAQSDGAIKATTSGNIAIKGLFANGINLLSFAGGAISLASSSDISLAQGGNGILAYSDGTVALGSSGAISITGDGTGINATAGDHVTVTSSGAISITGNGDAIDATDIGESTGGGAVIVNSSGAITLAGASANGINASSEATDPVSVTSSSNISLTNGGAGISASGLGAITVSSSGEISVAGGSGAGIIAASGEAGTVSAKSSGNISVAGNGVGIVAVSVGGAASVVSSGNVLLNGSGIGTSAIGGTDASVSSSGSISVVGDGNAISAISISANGTANVTSSGAVSLGGDGTAIAAASIGGAANVTSSGNVLVGGSGTGIDAEGSLVQVNSSGDISVAKGGTGITASGANGATVSSSGGIAIRGNGTAIDASTGAAANVTSSGNIFIGGSGTAIDALGNLVQVNSSGNISLANGGTGIKASGGGQVAVNSSGITSVGGNGTAIDAFSVAGATKVNSPGNIVIGGSGTGIAAGGNLVQVNASGDISLANGGTGISASGGSQAAVNSSGSISVGGEDGFGIAALDTYKGGVVSINSSGDVTAAGPASTAILAQATGGGIAVNIARGTITGGSGTGAGIELIGGGNNTLANAGTITTSAGLAGTAIFGMPAPGLTPTSPPAIGNNVVNNAGTIIGNVDLGPGRNAFNNLPGGTLNSGAAVNLGAGNPLNNSGNLSPGGSGVIQTTALTGNLVQGGAGKITVDVNPATGQADRINATGSANLGGQIVVNLANATPTIGTTTLTLVHAAGGATDDGLALAALPAVAAYQLEFANATDVVLQGGLTFAPAGLNGNQTSIGRSINAIQLAGGSPAFLPIVQAILTIPDLAGLGQAYNQLSPETYGDNEIADFYSDLRFAGSLMSCDVPDGRYVFIKEGQCVWAQLGGKFLDLNATSVSLGFGENAFVMSGGAEMMLRPDWFASFAFGYDHGNIDTADGWHNHRPIAPISAQRSNTIPARFCSQRRSMAAMAGTRPTVCSISPISAAPPRPTAESAMSAGNSGPLI